MKVLILLNHPAHYYVFKYTVINLKKVGFETMYLIREKDILEKLLQSEGVAYIKINEKRKRNANAISVISNGIIELLKQDFNLLRFVIKWKPDLMIGTDTAITHVGKLLLIPSFVFNEDDYEINKLFCKSSYPLATKIISPQTCSVGTYLSKKVAYNGIQKMAYLHPLYFTPDYNKISDYVTGHERYFIIRLVSLTSGHDIEGKHSGLNEDLVDRIIKKLEPLGKIIISSEGVANSKYEKYILNIDANKMHHLLAFADIFIGDSQTMCAEAGLLATPFIRFNDFVGKIEYLNEIENKYRLGYGVKTSNPEQLIECIDKILEISGFKEVWKDRREKIFNEKIDSTQWYTDYIINYLAKKQS